ncbi:hypothetical protein [Ulvibacterium marinum]|uniref:hypothetical protein n=1 Tax=Ulvibacterium marinum TaxID=2419782 RepID=UPI002494149E|nr:hypothetical protein [Ulvibacterium marinum]
MEEGWYNKFVIKRFRKELHDHFSYSDTHFKLKKTSITSHNQAFYKLKTTFDFNDKCIVADNLPEKYDKYLYGNPIPKRIEQLGESEYILESSTLEDEINWLFLTLRKYENRFRKFIDLKHEFDNRLLLGDYKSALAFLDQIEKEICVSLWGIENRLLIKEMMDGLEENKLYLNEINDSNKSGRIILLADFLSKRAEKELSGNRYKNDISNTLSRIEGNLKKETIEYYLFKTNYHQLGKYDEKCFINSIEFQHSLIDRYLLFIRILQNHLINIDQETDLNMIKSRLYYASKKLEKDGLIENMRLYVDPTVQFSASRLDSTAIEILDDYSSGDYNQVVLKLKKYLLLNPKNFELYVIYAKSLLNLKSEFLTIGASDTFQNVILKEVFTLLERKSEPEFAGQNLIKIAFQLESLNISSQIVNFVFTELESDLKYEKLSLLNSQFINPNFCHIYDNQSDANVFFRKIGKIFPTSSTINFLFLKLNRTLEGSVDSLPVAENRKSIYKALYYQDEKRYKEAINVWTILLKTNTTVPHLYESVVLNLYHCYFELNKLDDCLQLLVETYFINPHFIKRLNAPLVRNKIRENRFKNVSKNIFLPIFYWITRSEESAICNTYELFLSECQANTPSEFVKNIPDNIDKKYLIYFLDSVCNVETFKHSIFIEGSSQRLEERLNICKFLEEFDLENAHKYIEEISIIEKQTLVQKGLQEYDESKIFINKKMIVNSLLKDLEADFKRFLKIDSLVGDRSILLMSPQGINSVTLKEEGKSSKSKSASPFSESPLFDMIKGMFNEVRDKFLSSEYGLSAYLSTRIRHGVFEGEVRPQFEKLKLITEKDSESGIYKANEFWKTMNPDLDSKTEQDIQALLANFSQKIDTLINSVVKKNLQIKIDNKNPDGWFDYEFQDELLDKDYKPNILSMGQLYLIVKKNKNFDDFVNSCFDLLWNKTDLNLSKIRDSLKGDVTNKFEEIIEELEMDLMKIINREDFPELFQNIITSKVKVQNDINRIGRWFNRSGTQIKDFRVNKVVEITKENTNKHYEGKNKSIELSEKIETNVLIKGEYLPYLIDLMKIFFDNILKHTRQSSGPVPALIEIKTNKSNTYLCLNIFNDLFGDIDVERDNIDDYLNKFKADLAKSLTETNSGFHKAIRILKSDLGNKTNKIKIGTNDSNKFYIKCLINIDKLRK